jgi:3-oxoacyl-[acyl-carrier-protein] synthase II
MSDGGAALVLENLESALQRGAQIYCEVSGFSQNTDAFHILRPTDNGIGLYKAIHEAMIEAEVTPSIIDSINSHATSTPAGDLSEAVAIKKILGNKKFWNNLEAFKNSDPNITIAEEANEL